MSKFNWGMRASGVLLLWATAAIALPAQTFTTLYNFDGRDGEGPTGLVQAADGNFYGTTFFGGSHLCGYFGHDCGTVFKITPSGTLTTLHSFEGADGAGPRAGLVQGANGDFYGTTNLGGANGTGTVYKVTRGGTPTTLYSFCSQIPPICWVGGYPAAGLVQATNGKFYGATEGGGDYGDGTVFKITPSGTLTTLHSFDGTDGTYPLGTLIQAADGNLYGTTSYGGAGHACQVPYPGCGTVFTITPSGTLSILYSFDKSDGAVPQATLVQAANGNFYGTTYGGGASGDGTVFQITPSGVLTTLYNFCSQSNCTDGSGPGSMIQGTDGNFYGTTLSGGTDNNCEGYGCGTIFKITPGGTLTTLYSFRHLTGKGPVGLVQGTNGKFYGTTTNGGVNRCKHSGCGTVFSLSVGLGPFVKINPTSGAVGATVTILGNSLTGATSVTFNGTAATFTVVSASEITTTVPTGATTGTVQVVTPGGTLSSNVPFRVD